MPEKEERMELTDAYLDLIEQNYGIDMRITIQKLYTKGYLGNEILLKLIGGFVVSLESLNTKINKL